MQEKDNIPAIGRLSYELYKKDWVESHTTDQDRLTNMAEYLDYVKECTEEGIPYDSYDQFLFDEGFHGSIYVCLEEFMGAEYLDQAYMVGLLKGNEDLTKAYREDLAEQGIEIDNSLCYEEQKKPVFILCEEYESEDCPREFSVLAVSEDKEALQKLLAAKVEKDEYGFIGENGGEYSGINYFCSNFDNDRFVEYHIRDESVLSREKTLELLQTKAYDTTFVYPDNFRTCVLSAASLYAENENYGEIDCEKVADDLMQSKSFQAEVKQAWWFSANHLNDNNCNHCQKFIEDFLSDVVDESPDYFSDIGAIPLFAPPSNLKDIIVDCIYDVSKANHMQVMDPEEQADKIMRHSDFRSYITKAFSGVTTLTPGTMDYLRAVTFCMNQVKGILEPAPKKPDLASLIQNAENRTGEPSGSSPGKEPDR